MESESRMNNDEAVLFQEQDLNKSEPIVQSPNFESREPFTVEDNFDDNCSSTTGASGYRDASVSPQRFSNIGHEIGTDGISTSRANDVEVEFSNSGSYKNSGSSRIHNEICAIEEIEKENLQIDTETIHATSNTPNAKINANRENENIDNTDIRLNNSDITDEDLSSTEFLSRQRALDRANVFLRWNLTPSKQQIKEFLEMVQGKLNLSMVSEKGYDYCLLYFELLRDGLINAHLWRDTTIEELDVAITEARQTLNGEVTPPQNIKKRRVNHTVQEDNSSSYNSTNIGNEKIPLHILTKVSKIHSEFDDACSELQETPVNFNFEQSIRSDEVEGRPDVDNEDLDNSYNNLGWQGINSNSSKASDISLESNSLNLNKDTNADSNKDGSDSDDTGDNNQDNEGNTSSRQDAMNRLLNPKSGCKGVSWSNRQMAWLAFWKEDNQRRSKTFSARKLGFEEAQRRAIEFLRRKREEVRMKTQAHLYEELPRVVSSTINSSNDGSSIKTPSRRNYSNSNATTTATPATPVTPLELDQYSNTVHQFIPGFDDSSRNLITGANPLFSASGNILASNIPSMINHGTNVQQNVIQSNIGQPNILTATAAAAAAAHQMGLPFHLAALSSIAGGIPIDPSISATVAAATGINLGVQTPSQSQTNPINNFTHAALMATNPFFMFGAAAAAAAVGSTNIGPNGSSSHFPWQQFQNAGIGPLIQSQMQVDIRESSLSQLNSNNIGSNKFEQKSDNKDDSSEVNTNPLLDNEDERNESNNKTIISESKTEVIANDIHESMLDNFKPKPKVEEDTSSITTLSAHTRLIDVYRH
ncbi:AP2 domain-containing [Cryptosporidium sp. chipmunk genotype I]|uniref:AP2 domain-containing n=1 Tax=Cryptosporidium sp. chipmunk genotype I TaxID=1280935 RepID=UPI00351A70C6|nr:AP2 domain-containing [Cryptosporidium sp. chipmunk genotype I]